jgi:SAM-dependent methyltransferase
MNGLGRTVLNSPARAYAQRHVVLPMFERFAGRLDGCDVLEVGCGRGVGAALLIDYLGAARVNAIDIDPVMVSKAAIRLRHESAVVELGDMTQLPFRDARFDAVVDFGAMHLEPRWRLAVGEIWRVLRPGGRFLFEQIVGGPYRVMAPLATGRRIPGALTEQSLCAELVANAFDLRAVLRPRMASLTGTVGDMVGLAVKR